MSLKSWFKKRKAKKAIVQAVDDGVKKLDEVEAPFRPLNQPNHVTQMEEFSVTGSYRTVKAMVNDAIIQKRKARSSAQRVSDRIGVTPTPLPRPHK